MSTDLTGALDGLRNAIDRRNESDRDFVRRLRTEIDELLLNINECALAVASGVVPPGELQRLIAELDRLAGVLSSSSLGDAERANIMERLNNARANLRIDTLANKDSLRGEIATDRAADAAAPSIVAGPAAEPAVGPPSTPGGPGTRLAGPGTRTPGLFSRLGFGGKKSKSKKSMKKSMRKKQKKTRR
jgi:hypothetical protein